MACFCQRETYSLTHKKKGWDNFVVL